MNIWEVLGELSHKAKLAARGQAAEQRYMPTLDEASYRIAALQSGAPVSSQGPGMRVPTATGPDYLAGGLDAVTPLPVGPLKTVFHGTPHQWAPEPDFPQGRPRMDKIGTGEGAQVYGHGIYFAEEPTVAKNYRRKLTGAEAPTVSLDGNPFKELPPTNTPGGVALRAWTSGAAGGKGNLAETVDYLRSEAKLGGGFDTPGVRAARRGYTNAADWLEKMGPRLSVDFPGGLYSIDLPDEVIPRLLDWDEDLAKQPESVLNALIKYAEAPDKEVWDTGYWTGGKMMESNTDVLQSWDGLSKAAARERVKNELSKAGIPGLQYLDQFSRDVGNGTRNYVIWDQDLLNRMPILGVE